MGPKHCAVRGMRGRGGRCPFQRRVGPRAAQRQEGQAQRPAVAIRHRPPDRTMLAGAVCCAVGAGSFLATSPVRAGDRRAPSPCDWRLRAASTFGKVERTVRAVLDAGPGTRVIVVCGRNEDLRRRLAGTGWPPGGCASWAGPARCLSLWPPRTWSFTNGGRPGPARAGAGGPDRRHPAAGLGPGGRQRAGGSVAPAGRVAAP